MIKHFPITNIDKAIEFYSKKDGTPVKYVCTTDMFMSDCPVDIFYRETPHPKFGNRYFGLYIHTSNNTVMICGADEVEELTFGMVEDNDGDYQYSQSHHDYKSFDNGNMIDGGRVYIRSSIDPMIYVIRDGEMLSDGILRF